MFRLCMKCLAKHDVLHTIAMVVKEMKPERENNLFLNTRKSNSHISSKLSFFRKTLEIFLSSSKKLAT